MTTRRALTTVVAMALPLMLKAGLQEPNVQSPVAQPSLPEAEVTQKMAQGVMESMSSEHMHMSTHMKWTEPRPQNPEDLKRVEQIVSILRASIEKYRDYQVALQDGYKIFLPRIPQPLYHFTKYRYGFEAELKFDPSRPTSLLYKKTSDGYELVGAMYTATRFTSEDELNKRVPLSVARWHAHINICLPPRSQGQMPDLTKFGPTGSISSEAECTAAGGRFLNQIFGWMVHVYPFEKDPEKIWAH